MGQLARNDAGGLSIWPGSNVISGGVFFRLRPPTEITWPMGFLTGWRRTITRWIPMMLRQCTNWNYTSFMIDPNNIPYMDAESLTSFSISTTTNSRHQLPCHISNIASLFVVNSTADVLYEIQGCTNLANKIGLRKLSWTAQNSRIGPGELFFHQAGQSFLACAQLAGHDRDGNSGLVGGWNTSAKRRT